MKSHDLGVAGENLATRHLLSHGYRILERNWRHAKAEVDIIASKGAMLVAVEVKSRSSEAFGDPQGFISRDKIRLLQKAMNAYVNLHGLDLEVRFDAIGIVISDGKTRITHLKDAWYIF
jgi:putative endonuclease